MRTKIEVREIRKSFASDKGTLQVVDDVSFTVRRRRIRRHRRALRAAENPR